MRDPVVVTGLTILIVAGIFLAYPWTAAAALTALAAWYITRHATRAHNQHTAHHQALAARADQQHAQVLAGDPAGVYGQYPPAKVDA